MLNKVKVALAAGRKYVKPFEHTVDSTIGAFQITPVFYREVMPQGTVKCDNPFVLVYSNPMSVPTLAKYDFNFNRFFVPYKYVWPAWEDYQLRNLHYYPSNAGVPVAPAIPVETPFITQSNLVNILIDEGNGFMEAITAGSQPDVTVRAAGDGVRQFKWTRLGLMTYKLLNNLGYQLSWDLEDHRKFEILTLFCYGKCYMDYYFPKNYAYTSGTWYNIVSAFVSDTPKVEAASNQNGQYLQCVISILKNCTLTWFNNSEFYDAWDNPVAPNSGNIPAMTISDVTDVNNDLSDFVDVDSGTAEGTPYMSFGNMTNTFSGYIVQMLIKVTNFIKRYQLVGNDRIDRWLATFGVKLPDAHRAIHLGGNKAFLRVESINATSDSVNSTTNTNSVVGDRGGNGRLVSDDLRFSFENRENSHGMFFVLLHCSLDNYMIAGIDKMRTMVSINDRYNPEFDAQGVEMVTAAEINNNNDGFSNNAPSSFFGFLPRGYAYCLSRHIQSGAFRADTFGANQLKAWFPRKYFTGINQDDLVHNIDFMHPQSVDLDAANLPFFDLKYSENFIITCQFCDCQLIDFKKPLSDAYDFGDDEKNGSIMVDNQGSLIH